MSDKASVLDTAKRIVGGQDDAEVVLSTGIRVKLCPVSSSLVEELRSSVKMPDVPVVYIEAKDREEENPNDPIYIGLVQEAMRKQSDAMLDALILFGIELLDGLPDDNGWLDRLKFIEKRGTLDLSGFDLSNDFDLEFLYKRYVAVAGADLSMISQLHGFRPLEVARARKMFLGDEERSTSSGTRTEEHGEDGD